MTILETWTVQSNAKKDAKRGVESRDDVVNSLLGDRPTFDPSRPDHRRVDQDLHLDADISDRENELRGLEDERAHEPALLPMNLVLALCYITEPFACISLMKSYGFENPEKTIFGVMLAAGIFGITSIASRISGRARLAAYATYGALVLAVAGSRLAERGDGTAMSWTEAVVLMFLTIGPAMLAEWCWRRRETAAKLAKLMRNVRRRLAELHGRRARAQQFVDKIINAERRWDNDATVIKGTYAKEHRRRAALSGGAWPAHQPAGQN